MPFKEVLKAAKRLPNGLLSYLPGASTKQTKNNSSLNRLFCFIRGFFFTNVFCNYYATNARHKILACAKIICEPPIELLIINYRIAIGLE